MRRDGEGARAQGPCSPAAERKVVLLVDEQAEVVRELGAELGRRGYDVWVCESLEHASCAIAKCRPEHIISEFRIGNSQLTDFWDTFRPVCECGRLIVVTNFPSVTAAVYLTRLGVAGYFSKPAPKQAVLEIIEARAASLDEEKLPTSDEWSTLNRTMWIYLSNVYDSTGSLAQAARRLGLDRRSLRRMLAKCPPAR